MRDADGPLDYAVDLAGDGVAKQEQITFRCDKDLKRRIDALIERMQRESPEAEFDQSKVVRYLVRIALEHIEAGGPTPSGAGKKTGGRRRSA